MTDQPSTAHLEAARADERDALNQYLQNRVVILNVAVRERDERIQELEAEVAEHRAQANQAEPTQESDESPRALLDTPFPDPSTGS